jgi:hypothetical protein
MGMPPQAIALLLMEHRREPLTGPVLQYGEQHTLTPYDALLHLFASYGVRPDTSALGRRPSDYVPSMLETFGLFGLHAARTLDVSAYEGATIIADLSEPIPAA